MLHLTKELLRIVFSLQWAQFEFLAPGPFSGWSDLLQQWCLQGLSFVQCNWDSNHKRKMSQSDTSQAVPISKREHPGKLLGDNFGIFPTSRRLIRTSSWPESIKMKIKWFPCRMLFVSLKMYPKVGSEVNALPPGMVLQSQWEISRYTMECVSWMSLHRHAAIIRIFIRKPAQLFFTGVSAPTLVHASSPKPIAQSFPLDPGVLQGVLDTSNIA